MDFSSASPLRILLVEDDPISAIAARKRLAALGIEVDHAVDGEEALERHAAEPYRIVIADWLLPGLDGIELCRRLRALPGPYVYVLLCSGHDDRAKRLEAYDAGVDDFLSKPLEQDELRARLTVARRILAAEDRAAVQLEEREAASRQMAHLNESLKLASRRFEDLFDGLPVACFTFDDEGLVHEWNQAAVEAFGVAGFDTLTRPVWETLGGDEAPWSPELCDRIFAGTEGEFDWTRATSDGLREFTCRAIVLRGRGGQPVGAVCANVDVTARKRAERMLQREKATLEDANARLHELASKDGLTGLWNRRSFVGSLEAALAEFHRTGRSFSLVLLDIDRFKQYNDTFGHPAGDEVLRRFARVLRGAARASEHPARYGGEEFAIVIQSTGTAKGLAAAERFRRAVEDADWVERAVTCSLGVATAGPDGTTVEALVAAADAALYASKANGRNRCTHASGLPEATERKAA